MISNNKENSIQTSFDQLKDESKGECEDGYVYVGDQLFFRGERVSILHQENFIKDLNAIRKNNPNAFCIELTLEAYEKLITNNILNPRFRYSRNSVAADKILECEMKFDFHGAGLF